MKILSIFLMVVLFFSISCSAGKEIRPVAPAPATAATAQVTNVSEDWQSRWDKLMKEAKKEGIVTVYSTAGGDVREALTRPFQEKFGLRLEYVSGKGAETSQRISTERKSGLYLADLYLGGATTVITVIKPSGILEPLLPELILPEVLDYKAWTGGKLTFIDKDKSFLSFINYASNPIAVNTTLVKPDEIRSYRDLLNPRWKSKMIFDNPTYAGLGLKFVNVVGGQLMGNDYLKELARQEPIILSDQRQQVDWLAHGKYPIALVPKTEIVTEFRNSGAPLLEITPTEGAWTSTGSGNIALINKAPHPNATRVFINWILTKEQQSVISKAFGNPSRRVDVSTEGIEAGRLVKPGVKYIESDAEEILLEMPKSIEIAKQIFGPLMK